MRAYAIDEFGAPGSIHDVPDPTPGEGQVRVRVEAASVNPADLGMLGGAYKDFMEHVFPLVGGLDLGGVVDAVGPGVEGLAAGDAVFGVHGKRVVGAGTFAEYSVPPRRRSHAVRRASTPRSAPLFRSQACPRSRWSTPPACSRPTWCL